MRDAVLGPFLESYEGCCFVCVFLSLCMRDAV